MQAEALSSKVIPGEWQAEVVNYDGDGEVYVTIFSGPDAEVRAKDYCFRTMTDLGTPAADDQQFFLNSPIEDLARVQGILPLHDPGVLSGGIPENEDLGELLRDIYSARR